MPFHDQPELLDKAHRKGFVEAVKKAAAMCEARSQKLDAGGSVAATLRKQIANLINEYDHA